MKRLLLALAILSSSIAHADLTNLSSWIFDSSGNQLNSTSNALNSFITNSTLAVTQSGTWTTGRTWTLGASDTPLVSQGTASSLSGAWPIKLTDGTNTMPTMDVVSRPGFFKLTDGTNTAPTFDVAGRAGFFKVTDGTNTLPTGDIASRKIFTALTDGTNTTAVKAASTASLASDPSAVVALSPNSPVPAGTNIIGALSANQSVNVAQMNGVTTTMGAGATNTGTQRVAANLYDGSGTAITSDNPQSGTERLHVAAPDTTVASTALGALNATISINLAGLPGAGFQLASGTLIGTLTPQISYDGGTTWINTLFYNPTNQQTAATFTFSASNPTTVLSIVLSGGASNARVKVTSYTSGTANATMRATASTSTTITTSGGAVSSGAVFSVAVLNFSLATTGTENPILYMTNTSSNTVSAYIESSYCGINTANRQASFEVYTNPTVSANGTVVTPVNRAVGNSATSAMNVYKGPTITSNGSLISTIINAQNANSISIVDAYNLKILPGNSILITGNPGTNSTGIYISLTWSEY
jgi:hypothetical protein